MSTVNFFTVTRDTHWSRSDLDRARVDNPNHRHEYFMTQNLTHGTKLERIQPITSKNKITNYYVVSNHLKRKIFTTIHYTFTCGIAEIKYLKLL